MSQNPLDRVLSCEDDDFVLKVDEDIRKYIEECKKNRWVCKIWRSCRPIYMPVHMKRKFACKLFPEFNVNIENPPQFANSQPQNLLIFAYRSSWDQMSGKIFLRNCKWDEATKKSQQSQSFFLHNSWYLIGRMKKQVLASLHNSI